MSNQFNGSPSPLKISSIRTQKRVSKASLILKQITINRILPKVQEKSDILAAQIYKMVRTMPNDKRLTKAVRHIYDAYYLRSIRNDIDMIDKQFLRVVWFIENNAHWNHFLFLISIFYQFITFLEESTPNERKTESNELITIELCILLTYLIDFILTAILLITKPRDIEWKFNGKQILKMACIALCFIDFIINIAEGNIMRFSRICRPMFMIFYSKDLRRNLKGIVRAAKDLVLLFLLYVIVISIFAFIGINLIGSIPNVDTRTQDYGDFFQLFSMLFMQATLDFYPDILIPPMILGSYYSVFFVIYLLLFIFLFSPIPLAVVYEGFRKHRVQIAINDIIKQKSAMMASFISLDTNDKGYLSEIQFKGFLTSFYAGNVKPKQLQLIFAEIDKDFNDKIQFEEFYQLIILLKNSESVRMPEAKPLKIWIKFRKCLKAHGFKDFIEGNLFGTLMLIVTIVNCGLIIGAFFTEDQMILDLFNLIDTIFLVIFSLECVLKIIALGFKGFFDDGWNVFDFTLVILQIIFDYVLFNAIQGNIVQSIKANRILRLAKIQKVFRLFRAFRSIKVLGFLVRGLEIFSDVKHMLYKILVCIPLILRLMLPVQIVFFCYATLGVLLFGGIDQLEENPYKNTECNLDNMNYTWGDCKYADFDSFVGAYLIMLQIFVAAEWNQVVFQLTYDTGNMGIAMAFVGSFVFLSIFLLALIGGLVWEVFTVVSLSLVREERMEHENELQDDDLQLFSSVGSMQELKIVTASKSAQRHQKKTTHILNDDNPDLIQFRPRSQCVSKLSQRNSHIDVDRNLIPMEQTQQINITKYTKLLAGGQSKSCIQTRHQGILGLDNLNPANGDNSDIDFKSTNQLYLDNFIEYSKFLEQKYENHSFSVQHVSQEYIIHLRNEIKKDEIFKAKFINIQNHDQLIQNAVLRDTSEVYIKQQEDKYFKIHYGQQFERLKELKFQSKFKLESKILFSLMGILKFPKVNVKYFFQMLFLIENQLTFLLLPDCSFWKFIHEIDGSWYSFSYDDDNHITFTELKYGPWNYADELFHNGQLRICENMRFIKEGHDSKQHSQLKGFQKSLQTIAEQFDLDKTLINQKSACALYEFDNSYHVQYAKQHAHKKSNVSLVVDESPNQNVDTSQKQSQISKHERNKHVSKSMMVILYKNQGIEPRIVYQNQVMLIQFIQDIGVIISNYQSHYFQQIEDLYLLMSTMQEEND